MAIIDNTLLDNFELKGVWWLPDQQDNKISGILSFKSEENILLELIGTLHDSESYENNEIFQPEIILGLTDKGKLCTLYKNIEIKFRRSFPGIISSTLKIRYLFIGKHFNTKDSIAFSSMQANYTNLENWMWQIPFKTKRSKRTTTVSYSFPKKFEANLPDPFGKIQSTFKFRTSGDHLRNLNGLIQHS